tara:strand:+ start:381 stop:515 length:135 start_codon:yes stop_codon:yes gene_type:complete
MAEAHVNPDPKDASTTRSPFLIRPSLTASVRAMGMEAAVVFPYL